MLSKKIFNYHTNTSALLQWAIEKIAYQFNRKICDPNIEEFDASFWKQTTHTHGYYVCK